MFVLWVCVWLELEGGKLREKRKEKENMNILEMALFGVCLALPPHEVYVACNEFEL